MAQIIDGKYEILREIGRGGMSVVYLAMDRRLNKQWAIKEFRKDKDDRSKDSALKALLNEANLMKRLDHPTLPRIVDIINTQSTLYIVMDYIEGEPLHRVIEAGPIPQEAVIEWAKQLSEVLDYLHTQKPPIIYRDMKPANIMLKPDGTIRLFDFGIAREYKGGKSNDTEAIGTRGYAAPEQFGGGRGETDARTDIYGLGVTLYHLVTGKNPAEPPYELYPIRHWNPGLSSGLEWLIQKCTQLNPNDRFQTCAEVSYVLNNLSYFEEEWTKKKRSRIRTFVITAVLALAFGLASVGLFFAQNAEKQKSIETQMSSRTVEGYVNVIEMDDTYVEAYKALAVKLDEEITTVDFGKTTGNMSTPPASVTKQITQADLGNWFSAERMAKLKELDPKAYATVYYELGRLCWNCEVRTSDDTDENALEQTKETRAKGYFGYVVSMEHSETGLMATQYNLARAYYLVSYFRDKFSSIKPNDDARGFEVKQSEIDAGIYGAVDGKLENPYYSCWHTFKDLLGIMAEGTDLTTEVRVQTMERLTNLYASMYNSFIKETKNKSEKVDHTELEEFYAAYQKAIDEIGKSIKDNSADSNYDEMISRLDTVIRIMNDCKGKVEEDIEKIDQKTTLPDIIFDDGTGGESG